MGHIMVMVPDGHTVQVHPPGGPAMSGVMADPALAGAKAAMDAALPAPGQSQNSPRDKQQPKRKAKPKVKTGRPDQKD